MDNCYLLVVPLSKKGMDHLIMSKSLTGFYQDGQFSLTPVKIFIRWFRR